MATKQNFGCVSSIYHPSQSFIDTGKFLSNHSFQGNVVEFPIIAGEYLVNSSHSLWAVETPLSAFTSSFLEYRDRVGTNNTLTFPILSQFQTDPHGNISNYLSLYGIKYIVISIACIYNWICIINTKYCIVSK